MEYFIRLKVDKSKELLRETSMSIGEISSYLSFDTPNYFSKTFKKITGYTPTTYRKLRRQGK
jgi:YesN/AraC family two-component response regulator